MINLHGISGDAVLAEFLERAKSGLVNWDYVGNELVSAYRLVFPDVSFVIRGALCGKQVVFVLKMLDPSGETLGVAAGDSDEPESPHYAILGEILLAARHQAGDPFMEEMPESRNTP
jgi:hypothetical protein